MKNFLEIDLMQLEKEWIQQATLYEEHAEKLAAAKRDLDYAKNDLELADAEIDKDIRLFPEKYGLEKTTDKVVEAAIIREVKHQKFQKALIEAKYAVNIMEAVVTALDHKKKALENTVSMLIGGFFAVPRAKENSRDHIGDIERDAAFRRNKKRGDK